MFGVIRIAELYNPEIFIVKSSGKLNINSSNFQYLGYCQGAK